jgi:uncharacterized protein YcfL
MKKIILSSIIILFTSLFIIASCKNKEEQQEKKIPLSAEVKTINPTETSFDSTLVDSFFIKHPKLKIYQSDVKKLYQKRSYQYIWYDKNGINEIGNLLYDKISNLELEGIQTTVPYQEKLEATFKRRTKAQSSG